VSSHLLYNENVFSWQAVEKMPPAVCSHRSALNGEGVSLRSEPLEGLFRSPRAIARANGPRSAVCTSRPFARCDLAGRPFLNRLQMLPEPPATSTSAASISAGQACVHHDFRQRCGHDGERSGTRTLFASSPSTKNLNLKYAPKSGISRRLRNENTIRLAGVNARCVPPTCSL
jgi:hypothetical protein